MGKKHERLAELLEALKSLEEIVMAEDDDEDRERVFEDEPKPSIPSE